MSATASAIPGLVLSVVNDEKNNGIYFVQSVAKDVDTPGVLVKAGTGEKLTAATYADAILLAIEDNIGAVVYVSTDTEDGKSGLYVITEVGSIERLGTTTATGDLSGDVATLKTDVATLKGDVNTPGSVDQKIDVAVKAIDLSPYAKAEDVNEALEGKVSTDGYIAYTQEEKDKLEGIATGAQVNIIEKIYLNGVEVTADSQEKAVRLVTPQDVVRGLKDGENILSLDSESGKLGTTLSLEYYKDDENIPYIRLRGINGQVGDAINASEFIKDGMLSSADIVKDPEGKTGTFIELVFNTDSGVTDPMYVDVSDVFTAYVSGDGVEITDNVVKAKVYSSDKYLTVDTDGIKTKGIDDAITVAKNAVVGTIEDSVDSITIYGARNYAKGLVDEHDSAVKQVLDTLTVKSVDETAVSGISIVNTDGVIKANVDNDALTTTLIGAPGEIGPVSGTSIKLGQAITDGAEENPSEIISATASVQAAIQSLAGQIQAAVAGGITGISGDNYITVGGTATTKTLAVNTVNIGKYLANNNSAIQADSDTGKLAIV